MKSERFKPFTIFHWIALGVGVFLLFDLLTLLLAEGMWFQEVGYLPVFRTRLQTQGAIGLLIFSISLGFLWTNLRLARHRAKQSVAPSTMPLPGQMGLASLLFLAVTLCLGLMVMVLYHGQIAINHWHPNLSLYNVNAPRIPLQFRPAVFWIIGQQLSDQPWLILLLVAGAVALLLYSQVVLWAIALLMSLGFGLVLSEHWTEVLPYFNPTDFSRVDPLFNTNLSFYIFRLPLWELMEFWVVGLSALGLFSVLLLYLLANRHLEQGKFPGFTPWQHRHLCSLGGCVMLSVGLAYWLGRYELLYSPTGVTFGASYTDVTVRLPTNTVLSLVAFVLGGGMLLRGWLGLGWCQDSSIPYARSTKPKFSGSRGGSGDRRLVPRQASGATGNPPAVINSRRGFPLLYVLGIYLVGAIAASLVLPAMVQRLVVQPDELRLETPYLERTINLTREAYDLDEIEDETFNPQDSLTFADLQTNELTVKNIRLWDTRPLLETNRQLQRIRPYYEFPGADIDRYTLLTDDGNTEQQQVLIAARELDYSAVPQEAQTWVNQHLIYTHGYGFTLSPVNTAGEGGLPDYFIRGIEMLTSSPRIRNSIPIGEPRIYYGELTNTYVMTGTRARELDYPSGSENVYNTYDGRGGVSIGAFWRRLIYAKHLRDWRMLLTNDFTPDTRLLFRRTIDRRVRAIAPFLRYDNDPYLVVANAGNSAEFSGISTSEFANPEPETPNYLYWVIDAYTTSDRYPYSDPLRNDFNYIRNSVKVVIDAYNGSIAFFVADERDPIIQTWSKIFPGMFKSLAQMPVPLQVHLRYPQDFFRVQSDQLMVYHMTDPQVFYNREDQWRAPSEIYADESQLVAPYYLIMKLPAEEREEFILLRPFTPSQRNNLIAWLAARSDRIYQSASRERRSGNMLLYRFPKQDLVFGPEQIEARINQDPVISQRISLWNRRGSSAVQGNLLVIPIEQSLLYVEPLYLEATINRLPTLARVITAYGNRIVMAESLNQSLEALFLQDETTTNQDADAIIRSLDREADTPIDLERIDNGLEGVDEGVE
jgi:uncharacterized membrane protein (UPF0182 family)